MPTDPTTQQRPTPASPPHPARRRRWVATTVVVGVAAILATLGATGAGTGAAEGGPATALASTPANGEALPLGPASVSLTFPTEVTAGPAGITVVDAGGNRVDRGVTTRPAPNQLRVQLAPDLPDGTYRADYRAIDATGDVLVGYTAFGVGPPPDPAVVDALAPQQRPVVGAWTLLAAAAVLAGALTATGLAVVTVLVVPPGGSQRRMVPWVRGSVLVGVVGAVAVVVGRAAVATGDGLGSVTRPGVLGEVLRQGGTGWWLVGLIVGLAVIHVGIGLAAGPIRQALVVYGALVAVGSFALTGHVALGSSLLGGIGAALHVAVAALWVGGVVALTLLAGGRATDGRTSDGVTTASVETTRRFAPLAAGSLVVLWITGLWQTVTVAGSLSAVTGSAWGTTLVVKAAVVLVVLVVALWGRRALGERPDRLRRVLGIQASLVVVVVALSALLAGTTPEPAEPAGAQPSSQTLPVTAGVDVNLLVTPGTTGLNEIHVTYLDDSGALTDRIESVTVELSLPFAGIGPIVIGGPEIEPGHYLVITENLTTPGVWRMDVVSRIGTTEQRRTTFEVPIGD